MFTCYRINTKYSLVLHSYSDLILAPYSDLKQNELFHLCGVFRTNPRGKEVLC